MSWYSPVEVIIYAVLEFPEPDMDEYIDKMSHSNKEPEDPEPRIPSDVKSPFEEFVPERPGSG